VHWLRHYGNRCWSAGGVGELVSAAAVSYFFPLTFGYF
jgi:hypothetical protein